jgi:hypothetical protein
LLSLRDNLTEVPMVVVTSSPADRAPKMDLRHNC